MRCRSGEEGVGGTRRVGRIKYHIRLKESKNTMPGVLLGQECNVLEKLHMITKSSD